MYYSPWYLLLYAHFLYNRYDRPRQTVVFITEIVTAGTLKGFMGKVREAPEPSEALTKTSAASYAFVSFVSFVRSFVRLLCVRGGRG